MNVDVCTKPKSPMMKILNTEIMVKAAIKAVENQVLLLRHMIWR